MPVAVLTVSDSVTLVVRSDVAWLLGVLLLMGLMSCAFTVLEWRDALRGKLWRRHD